MENYNENNKLFSFDGIINRRNYIVNLLFVETIIQALISTPLMIIAFKSDKISGAILGGGTMPAWWNIILCLSSIISALMYMPSIVRRLRDILGDAGKNSIKLYSIFIFIILILGIPTGISQEISFGFIKIIGLSILLVLAFIKGTITGKQPKNKIVQFNWGAFIGTWIWGVINKSYIALLALPLTFTLGALPFYIICGIKGNEWAYEKSNNKDIESFHIGQKNQTIAWFIIFPILFLIFSIFASIQIYNFTSKYAKEHPDFTKKAVEFYISTESKAATSMFDKIELTEDEYKFYINPKKWTKSSYQQKISTFDIASSYIILQQNDNNDIVNSLSKISLGTIIGKIKIYSTFNNELLGEFHLDKEKINALLREVKNDPQKQKEIINEIKKGYRFNIHPSIP